MLELMELVGAALPHLDADTAVLRTGGTNPALIKVLDDWLADKVDPGATSHALHRILPDAFKSGIYFLHVP